MRVSIKAAIDGYPPLSDTPMLLDVWQLFSCCQWCRSALPKEGATTTNNHKGINILGLYTTYYGTIPFIPQDEEVEGCSTLADLEIVLKVINRAPDMFDIIPILCLPFLSTTRFTSNIRYCNVLCVPLHSIKFWWYMYFVHSRSYPMTNHFFMLQPIIVKSSIDGRTQYVSIVQFDCDDIIYWIDFTIPIYIPNYHRSVRLLYICKR
jgi:hypothetical protein